MDLYCVVTSLRHRRLLKNIKVYEALIITLYLAENRAYLIHKILMAFTHQVRCIVHLYIVVTSSEGHKPHYMVTDLSLVCHFQLTSSLCTKSYITLCFSYTWCKLNLIFVLLHVNSTPNVYRALLQTVFNERSAWPISD